MANEKSNEAINREKKLIIMYKDKGFRLSWNQVFLQLNISLVEICETPVFPLEQEGY